MTGETASTATDELLYAVEDGIATITLNRPDRLNAFTPGMLDAWVAAYEESQRRDDVRCIVLTGAGRGFCTGGDVKAMGEGGPNTPLAARKRIWEEIQAVPKAVAKLDKPIVAAINGVATGGGLDYAMMCDVIVAAESARMAETYSKLGLIPGGGGCWYMPRLVGRGKALELLWTADFVDAKEALRIGLVHHVWPDDVFMEKTYELARKIADAAPLSVRFIKRTVDQGLRTDLITSLDALASHMTVVRSSEDHLEAIRAFREKRKPVFKGR